MLVNKYQSLEAIPYLDVFMRCSILIDPILQTILVRHDVHSGEVVTREKLCTMANPDFEEIGKPARPFFEGLVREVGGIQDDTRLEPSVLIPRPESSSLHFCFDAVVMNGQCKTNLHCFSRSTLICQESSAKGRFQST